MADQLSRGFRRLFLDAVNRESLGNSLLDPETREAVVATYDLTDEEKEAVLSAGPSAQYTSFEQGVAYLREEVERKLGIKD